MCVRRADCAGGGRMDVGLHTEARGAGALLGEGTHGSYLRLLSPTNTRIVEGLAS